MHPKGQQLTGWITSSGWITSLCFAGCEGVHQWPGISHQGQEPVQELPLALHSCTDWGVEVEKMYFAFPFSQSQSLVMSWNTDQSAAKGSNWGTPRQDGWCGPLLFNNREFGVLNHRIYCLPMAHIGFHGILWHQPNTVNKICQSWWRPIPFWDFFFYRRYFHISSLVESELVQS